MSQNKPYTEKQRQKVYRIALAHFKRTQQSTTDWMNRVEGMCNSIEFAVEEMRRQGYARRHAGPTNLPEYWAFKPKYLWREDTRYWFTRYLKRGGYKKRVALLTALVDGKSPEEWRKEWKAAGHR